MHESHGRIPDPVTLVTYYVEAHKDGLVYKNWRYQLLSLTTCPAPVATGSGFSSQSDAFHAGEARAAREGLRILTPSEQREAIQRSNR